MQRGDHAVHLVVVGGAFACIHARQLGIPENAAVDTVHHVEGRADHRWVLAQRMSVRHRHLGGGQRLDDAELALHRMRRRQQRAGRLAPHHISMPAGDEQKGRVALATLELLHLELTLEAIDVFAHECSEPASVEGMLRGDRTGAAELRLGVVGHVGHIDVKPRMLNSKTPRCR